MRRSEAQVVSWEILARVSVATLVRDLGGPGSGRYPKGSHDNVGGDQGLDKDHPLYGAPEGIHTPEMQQKMIAHLEKATGQEFKAHGSVSRGNNSPNDMDIAVKDPTEGMTKEQTEKYWEHQSDLAHEAEGEIHAKLQRGEITQQEAMEQMYGGEGAPPGSIEHEMERLGFEVHHNAEWLGIMATSWKHKKTGHVVDIWQKHPDEDFYGLRAAGGPGSGRYPKGSGKNPQAEGAIQDTVKQLAAAIPPWKRIHAAADKHEAKLMSHVEDAFDTGRKTVAKSTLVSALKKGHQSAEELMDTAVMAMKKAMGNGLEKILLDTMKEGGRVGANALNRPRHAMRAAQEDFTFDHRDVHAIDWAKAHAADLLDDLSETSREDIRDAITRALEGEIDLEEAADEILDAVGDKARARMITRTESMRAVSEGQRQAWGQAKDNGLLSGDETRVWIITPYEACPECEALDGQEAPLDGTYPGGIEGPPLHPNCRCTEGIGSLDGGVDEEEE